MAGLPGWAVRSDHRQAAGTADGAHAPGRSRVTGSANNTAEPLGKAAAAADAAFRRPAPLGFVQQHSSAAAKAAEAEPPASRPSFMVSPGRAGNGLGPQGDPPRRRLVLVQPVRHQGHGANWKGPTAEVTTTEYINGKAQKVVAKFRAYGSYAESPSPTTPSLMKDSPRYQAVVRSPPAADVATELAARAARSSPMGLQKAGYATDPAYADKLTQVSSTRRCACSARWPERAEGTCTMGASPLMSLGIKRDERRTSPALQATGHNIANANVARLLAPARPNFVHRRRASSAGAGFFGRGVDVATASRAAHNAFLTREVGQRQARCRRWTRPALGTAVSAWRSVFAPGETGLGHATTELFDAPGGPISPATPPTWPRARWCWRAHGRPGRALLSEAGDPRWTRRRPRVTAVAEAPRSSEVNQPDQGASPPPTTSIADACSGAGPARERSAGRTRPADELAPVRTRVRSARIEADDGTDVGLFIGGGQRLVLGAAGGAADRWCRIPSDPSSQLRRVA